MPTPAHHRGRVLATTGVAVAHGYLSLIAFNGLLNYTVPTYYSVLEQIASETYWAWIHLVCALLLLGSLRSPLYRLRIRSWSSDLPLAALACSLGFAMLTTWALFNLLWGLSTIRPVSLAGPGLALVVAFGEQLLANAWTRGTYTRDR